MPTQEQRQLSQPPWIKQLYFFAALTASIVIIFANLHLVRQFSNHPYRALVLTLLVCQSFYAIILLGWISFGKVSAIFFSIIAITLTALDAAVTREHGFLILISSELGLLILIQWAYKRRQDEIVLREVDNEKQVAEKNDLELLFIEKGKGISVCFEKYSTYYNLRRLADEFSTSLSLQEVAQVIVSKSLEFIQRGDWCLLFLAEPESEELSLIASKQALSNKKMKKKLGDIFDFWVIRNRQHLLVTDTQKDFRFDLRKIPLADDVRSAIVAPISHEGRIIGTLRINSKTPSLFTTDHLRLLDAIATLASSALSNAMLYQKTEDLAIRDSLTGLYVQRYFMERLQEEHKRALLTHGHLSLLMCDLDYFKQTNDQYGHAVGDLVLTKVSEILRQHCDQGIVARYGGEEFIAMLPQVAKKEAIGIAEKIRIAVSKTSIDIRRQSVASTISIGVSHMPSDSLDSEDLIRKADEKLYQAKKLGRNRVC